jgi:hypothetical protein
MPAVVRQQMSDRDDALCRPCDDRFRLEVVADENLRFVELWEIAHDRILELERTFLAQSKEADRDNGLGQRRDQEDIFYSERATLVDVSAPECAFVNNPTVRPHVEHRARNLAPLHRCLNDLISIIKPPPVVLRPDEEGHRTAASTNPVTGASPAQGPPPVPPVGGRRAARSPGH